MTFDPTQLVSEKNRARPITAAAAFAQSEAKGRIMMAKRARRIGFGLAVAGVGGALFKGRSQVPDIKVTFPDGHVAMFTFQSLVSLFLIPIGLAIGIAGFFLYRKYMRAAMADPMTAGIFDPSVEWPEEV